MDNENKKKELSPRKKAVKRFATVFFVVLLLLTFFSNTIMNYSLPEVSTVTIYNGSVSEKVRCEGVVEASKDNEITVSGERTVKEVKVENGDSVKKGDVIATFEETENSELKAAEDELDQLQTAYAKSQLKLGTDYTEDDIAIANAATAVTDATTAVADANTNAASLATAKADLETAKTAYDSKKEEVAGLQAKVDAIQQLGEAYDGTEDLDSLVTNLSTANTELAALETDVSDKTALVTDLESKPTVEDAEADLKLKQESYDSLTRALEQKKLQDGLTAEADAMDDAAALKAIEEAEAKVEKLKDVSDYSEVKASADGIVSGLSLKAGDVISGDTPLGNIQLTDGGYEVSVTITKKDASKLHVGDEAVVENVWDDSVSSEIKSIKADSTNPNQNSIVKFMVKGDVQVGQTLQFAVGNKGGKYDNVVPNSAVKEDSDGKFVLVVKVKGTPLGNRYIVKKSRVEVLASDTTNSAISGEISAYDNVVSNSSKPLDNGQQVRLSESQ